MDPQMLAMIIAMMRQNQGGNYYAPGASIYSLGLQRPGGYMAGLPQLGSGGMGLGMLMSLFGGNRMGGNWMGPMGGGSPMDQMMYQRQTADIMQLRQSAIKQDEERVRAFVTPLVRAAYAGDPNVDVDKLVGKGTQAYASALPWIQAFIPGFENFVVPGGMTEAFSTRMYMAGLGARGAPGQYGLSAGRIEAITQEFQRRFRPGGRGLDLGFSRGFTTGDMGSIAHEMAQRNMMQFGQGTPSDNQRIVQQISDMAKPLDTLKDLMGDPDAPIPQLFQKLDEIFGGSNRMSAAKMEQILGEAKATGRMFGIAPTAMLNIMQGGAMQAQAMGMAAPLGVLGMGQILGMGDAYRALGQGQKGFNFGPNEAQAMDAMQRTVLGGFTSSGGARSAVLFRIYKGQGTTGNKQLDELFAKMESGQQLSPADAGILDKVSSDRGAFSAAIGQAGWSQNLAYSMMNDQRANQEALATMGYQNIQIPRRRLDMQRFAVRGLLNNAELRALGLDSLQDRERLVSALFGAKDISAEGVRNIIAGFAGPGADPNKVAQLEASVRDQFRRVNQTFGLKGFNIEDTLRQVGDESLLRQRASAIGARTEAKIESALKDAGIGVGKGPGTALVQNLFQSVMGASPDTDMTALVTSLFGGVGEGKFKEVMQSDAVKNTLKDILDLKKQIKELDDKEIENEKERKNIGEEKYNTVKQEIEAKRKGLLGDLTGKSRGLSWLQDAVNPELEEANRQADELAEREKAFAADLPGMADRNIKGVEHKQGLRAVVQAAVTQDSKDFAKNPELFAKLMKLHQDFVDSGYADAPAWAAERARMRRGYSSGEGAAIGGVKRHDINPMGTSPSMGAMSKVDSSGTGEVGSTTSQTGKNRAYPFEMSATTASGGGAWKFTGTMTMPGDAPPPTVN